MNIITMLEKEIKDFLQKNNLKQADIYSKLDISKQNFYKAIRTKNFENPTLLKILNFLGLEIIISLKKTNDGLIKKSKV
ncbi:MAG: hypothetical protein PHE25_04330 [Candidatus Gracilibacteria bacterium]|nr:hypothetical protein [Candidatus Gracilibacteria bacterium]